MPVSDTDIREIQAKIAPLLGQKTWGAALGVGSFVTLEFGQSRPAQQQGQRVHGEWHLWVYCSAWRLEQGDNFVAGSEDGRPKLEASVTLLNGLTLQAVDVRPPALEVVFTFDRGIVLRVFPIFSEDFEHWMLYTPDGNVLTAGPGASWTYERASTLPG
jgi:hypothetical protein